MKTLFDSNKVEIVEIKDAQAEYPNLNWPRIKKQFIWSINDHEVMAVNDLLKLIELNKRGVNIDDVEYSEIEICSVCRKVLLPDDECYVDYKTGDPICDEHSFFAIDDMYHKKIF